MYTFEISNEFLQAYLLFHELVEKNILCQYKA